MPFYKKCGKNVYVDAAFCPNCGTPIKKTSNSTIPKDLVHPSKAGHGSEGTGDFETRVRTNSSTCGIVNLEDLLKGHDAAPTY